MWKWISGILLTLLILSNGWWFYAALDQISIMKYSDLENYELRHRVSTLKIVANSAVEGLSRDQAEALLKEIEPDHQPFEKEGYLNGIWLSLEMDESGRVVKIKWPTGAT